MAEVDSYKDEPHLRKVMQAVGRDENARGYWEELLSLTGPSREIAMGEFDRVAP